MEMVENQNENIVPEETSDSKYESTNDSTQESEKEQNYHFLNDILEKSFAGRDMANHNERMDGLYEFAKTILDIACNIIYQKFGVTYFDAKNLPSNIENGEPENVQLVIPKAVVIPCPNGSNAVMIYEFRSDVPYDKPQVHLTHISLWIDGEGRVQCTGIDPYNKETNNVIDGAITPIIHMIWNWLN